jgi:hypothetical protein
MLQKQIIKAMDNDILLLEMALVQCKSYSNVIPSSINIAHNTLRNTLD